MLNLIGHGRVLSALPRGQTRRTQIDALEILLQRWLPYTLISQRRRRILAPMAWEAI